MREIKFRAWDVVADRMFSWEVIKESTLEDFYEVIVPSGEVNLVTMQYTGLKDKNGREIYEGDILQMAGRVEQPRWQVVWYENAWQTKLAWIEGRLPKGYYVRLSSDKLVEFDEVIGNIYENNELLKENTDALEPAGR